MNVLTYLLTYMLTTQLISTAGCIQTADLASPICVGLQDVAPDMPQSHLAEAV